MMRSHNKVYAAGDAPLLLDVVQQPGVTCEAVAAAAARDDGDAVDAHGATALHLICANERATPALLRAVLCRIQIFNSTSMCACATVSTQLLWLGFENSMRAIDSSKNQPNRLRFDRAREF